jgi:hypothetical protein
MMDGAGKTLKPFARTVSGADCATDAFAEPYRPFTQDPRRAQSGERAFVYASSGRAWRLLPKNLPPFLTVRKYFYRWRERHIG